MVSRSHSCYAGAQTAPQALGLLTSWTSAVSTVHPGHRSPEWCVVRSRLCCIPSRMDTRQPQALQHSPLGALETWARGGNSWAGAASLTTNISGKAQLPTLHSWSQPSPAPSWKTTIPSLSQFLNPEHCLPSPLIPHTFTGTVGRESLPSVKVIFSCFKKSTYSSYYSEDEKNLPLFLA